MSHSGGVNWQTCTGLQQDGREVKALTSKRPQWTNVHVHLIPLPDLSGLLSRENKHEQTSPYGILAVSYLLASPFIELCACSTIYYITAGQLVSLSCISISVDG